MEKKSIFGRIGAWIKNEAQKLRPLTWKQRLEYFRMYYLVPGIIAITTVFFVVWTAATIIGNSSKEIKLYVHLANGSLNSFSQWIDDYETARAYEEHQSFHLSQGQYTEGNEINTYSISVYAATESLDVLVCDDNNLEAILKMGVARELTDYFDEDVDAAVQDLYKWVEVPLNDTYGDGEEEYLTGNYAVNITGTPFADLVDSEGTAGNVYLLVAVNTPRAEEVNAFFQYVLAE